MLCHAVLCCAVQKGVPPEGRRNKKARLQKWRWRMAAERGLESERAAQLLARAAAAPAEAALLVRRWWLRPAAAAAADDLRLRTYHST